MTRIDMLKESRRGATVAFMKFTLLKERHSSDFFCCFEGDDVKYYGARVENILKIDIDNMHFFNCGGKAEVIKFYDMINKDDHYENVKISYFVDKDFDGDLSEKYSTHIYQTPVYSVENYYTTISAFKKILKYEFNVTEAEHDFKILLDLYTARQIEFHTHTKLINAWLWCQRDLYSSAENSKLNLDQFNLKKIVPVISLFEVTSNYTITKLEQLFPESKVITKEALDLKLEEIANVNPQERFRGKFEIDFLFEFIESLKNELTKKEPIIKKRPGVKINQSKKNMISELSQYAYTHKSLADYLQLFLVHNKLA
ncbi:DUF4435 domain-containing protein [Paenibacillus amylolyticus]|uniref:DUF4435 domain-containing protein n=1 Tax=Paenibacillus amylolyticus TaxID=1451 RepID=UPI003D9941EC